MDAGRSNRARVDCDTLVCENEEDYVLLRVTSQPFQIISRAKLTTNCSVSSYLRCLPGGSEGSTPGSGTPGSNRGGGPRPTRDTGQRSRSAQDRQGTVAPQRPPPASVCGEVSKPLIITLDSIGYPNASDSRRKHIRGLSQISNTNTDCSVLSTIPGSNKDPDSDVPGNEVAALLISRVIIHLPGIGNTSCSMAVDVYLPRENGTLTVGNQIAELSPQIVKFSVNITEPDKCFCRNLSDPTTCEDVMELAIRVVVAGLRHPQKLAEERRKTCKSKQCKCKDCMFSASPGANCSLSLPNTATVDGNDTILDDPSIANGDKVLIRIRRFHTYFYWDPVASSPHEPDDDSAAPSVTYSLHVYVVHVWILAVALMK